ncbi:MAG: hypothetical protein RQ729_13340 [Wenzhouxiangellaceae bacterium]|nr:hypothetical protein [Wenzhouxiangellaceae bacterium]
MYRDFLNHSNLRHMLRAGLLALALAALVPAPAAFADSLREVAERVARQHDAKVVSAREVERRGRRFYEIRILTKDGVVRTIRVPAEGRSNVNRGETPLLQGVGGPSRADSVGHSGGWVDRGGTPLLQGAGGPSRADLLAASRARRSAVRRG